MGLGAGVALGQNMTQALKETPQNLNTAEDIVGKLTQLKQLFDSQLISEAEYKTKKQDILAKM
jgi:hypothetical protein